jgi:putative protease
VKNYIYLGTVECNDERGFAKIEQKNKFSVGETIEIMKPDGRNVLAEVRGIYTEEGVSQESAPHPKQILYIDLSEKADQYDILRKKED